MAATPLHICMDSTDWLKGLDPESALMDPSFSSSDSDGLITCPPLLSPPPPAHSSGVFDRRLRPQQEQALKCPRCDSTHTKFCYYNNYSLSQPRYFCKTCRRYWTKGGSLRNVPVGGGCRKNKRPAISKKTSSSSSSDAAAAATAHHHHLSFSDLQFPHFDSAAAAAELSFIECKYNPFMLGGSGRQFLFGGGGGDLAAAGFSLGLPFEHNNNTAAMAAAAAAEVKPAAERMLAIDWEEQRCAEAGREAVGYGNGLGLWGAGMIGGGRGHPTTT